MKITVFTPTYNRAYILETLYRSIQRQTFRDFEWLIIDDGSTDNTEELVAGWKKEGKGFPIRYYKQSNGGKCRAINKALDLAEGELFFTIDSDDYLADDALEKVASWTADLPGKEKYCGVAGNCGTGLNETPNTLFDDEYYEGTLLDRYINVDGERACVFFTETHKKYKYPGFEDEKFMTEAVAWNRMAHDGLLMRFYDDVIWIYEYQEDGLTKAGNQLFLRNPQGYALWLREKAEFSGADFREKFKLWYMYYCEMSFCEEAYRLTKKQCADYIGAPLWAIQAAALIHRMKGYKQEK